MTTLSDQLAPLAARLADIQEQRTGLDEIEKSIKAAIKALVPGPDTYEAGPLKIIVSQPGRLDTKAIAAKWSIEERPELYDPPAVSTAKARAHIAPADLEAFTTTTAPSVRLA